MLVAKQGTLVVPGATGSVDYTTIGFQPKFGFFWGTKNTATGFQANRDAFFAWVAGDLTTRALSTTSGDAQADTSTIGRRQNTANVQLLSCASSIVTPSTTADLTAWLSNGFTINWIDVGDVGAIVHFIVFGGTDITDTWAGTINSPTSTGQVGYTDPNFTPDLLMLMSVGENTTVPGSFTQGRIAIGAATSPTEQFSLFVHDATGSPTQVADGMATSILDVENLASTKMNASLVSLDQFGWTLDWTTVNATSAAVFALAVKGGSYKVVTDTQRTDVGTKSKGGLGQTPAGVLFLGVGRAGATTKSTTESKLTIGATDGTNQSTAWGESTDNVTTTDCNSYAATDACLVHAANPSTVSAKASIASLDPGGYTLSWDTADAVARDFMGIAVGPTQAPAGFVRPHRVMS